MAKTITSLGYSRIGYILDKLTEYGLSIDEFNALSTYPEFGKQQVQRIKEEYRKLTGKEVVAREDCGMQAEIIDTSEYFTTKNWSDYFKVNSFPETEIPEMLKSRELFEKLGIFVFYIPERIKNDEFTLNSLLRLFIEALQPSNLEVEMYLEREKVFTKPVINFGYQALAIGAVYNFDNKKFESQQKTAKELCLSFADFQTAVIGLFLFYKKNKRMPDLKYPLRLKDIPQSKHHLTLEIIDNKIQISLEKNSTRLKVSALPMLILE
ncbi:MAG: hypothetical protein ACOYMB_00695 [Patescibacteria group bacterium]